MVWEVEYTNEFGQWWAILTETQQEDISAIVELLKQEGPKLRFPYSSSIVNSRHEHLRELRIQSQGNPLRVFYGFDPRRSAILLIGADKTGNDRFYKTYIPKADKLYDEHLQELKEEGLI